jgi:hypothetical protein
VLNGSRPRAIADTVLPISSGVPWAAADEGVLPAAGLSKKPSEIPLGVHVYALGGYLVYGATLETCRRIAGRVMDAWDRSGQSAAPDIAGTEPGIAPASAPAPLNLPAVHRSAPS